MLPKKYRLKKEKDFQKVTKRGKGLREGALLLKYLKNDLGSPRIGFVVSKKISSKAHVRNKVKRRLRETIKVYLPRMKVGYDLIFFTKKGVEEKTFSELQKTVEELLMEAKVIQEKQEARSVRKSTSG